jgi:hypothetical protein
VQVPGSDALAALLDRARSAGHTVADGGGAYLIAEPAGAQLRVSLHT